MDVCGRLHTLATLSQTKNRRCPFDMELCEPQSWSGLGGDENQIPVVQPVALSLYSTALT